MKFGLLAMLGVALGISSGLTWAVADSPTPACDQEPGHANSYVLALSLLSAFCETGGVAKHKPECLALSSDSHYVRQFGLHGLWPNQIACGASYAFCNQTPNKNNYCAYAPLALNAVVESALKYLMPSYNYGSCLERHEWNKHGTCQLRSTDDYFGLAVELTTQMNNSILGDYINVNIGKTISAAEFRWKFEQSFGAGLSDKIQLLCSSGKLLSEIYINLPNLDRENSANLSELLPQAKKAKNDTCPKQFTLSDFGV